MTERTPYMMRVILAICGWATLFLLQHKINHEQGKPHVTEMGLSLPSGQALKIASLEFNITTADLLWLRAIQLMGKKEALPDYNGFYHIIDRVTDLDPKFKDAYKGGAVMLSVLSDYPDLSTQLLEKGIKDNPDDWQMPFYIGFNYLYHKKDFLKAATAMERASQIEGRPDYLPFLTARLYNQGENSETAVLVLKGVYLTIKDEKIKEEITKRIVELEEEISRKSPPGNIVP